MKELYFIRDDEVYVTGGSAIGSLTYYEGQLPLFSPYATFNIMTFTAEDFLQLAYLIRPLNHVGWVDE